MSGLLTEFHFLRPAWLALLLPVLALWWVGRRARDPSAPWRGIIDPALLKHLMVGTAARRRVDPASLLLAGCVLGILAVAGPTVRQEPSPFAAAARPAMVVLKVTPSMLAEDLKPTRLDRARQKLADLLALREGAPTGLIAYAGSAHLVLPPTPDAEVVKTMAQALSPAIMPKEGDALAAALTLAAQVLADGGQGGSIVVLADTVAPAEATQIHKVAAPVDILPMQPPQRVSADRTLLAAADAAGADLITPTLDTQDVTKLARRLATGGPAPQVAGEGQRWQEAGYWATPFIALLVLGWFRRGWVLP